MTDPKIQDWRSATGQLLTLALPIIGLTSSRMLMGFIDFVMVSTMGSTAAQAAISPATLFVFVVGCVGMGIAGATQTFIAQADGRGEPRLAGSYAWQILYIGAGVALVTAALAPTTEHWFGVIAAYGKHSAEMAALEIEYIRVALWGLIPCVLCFGLEGFFNGIQRPRVPLIATVAALGVNALGNWLLIFGHLGFPKMGIAGAALATVLGWWVRVGIMLWAMLLPEYDARYNTRHSLRLDTAKLGGLLRIGGPTAFQWLVDLGAWNVFLLLIIPPLGETVAAASNVGLQLMHLSFMPAIGIGVALCSQVGFAIGEQRPQDAVQRARIGFVLNGLYMGAIGLGFLIFRDPLIKLFNTDPLVVQVGGHVLIWAAVFQVFDAMGITFMNALRGAGDTRWPAIFMGIVCWGVFVTGGFATVRLRPEWGLNGPWAMCTLYIIIVGLGMWWRWAAGHWRAIRLFDERQVAVQSGAPAGTAEPAADQRAPGAASAGGAVAPAADATTAI